MDREKGEADFNPHAESYDDAHRQNIQMGGEEPDYYASYKAKMMQGILGESARDLRVLDFGCAIGNLTEKLVSTFPGSEIWGYDPADKCVEIASKRVNGATFTTSLDSLGEGSLDAIVMANVLHHIPPHERSNVVTRAAALLRPQGAMFVFEHNPYNPLTQYVVKTCPFDEGVVLLPPREVRKLLAHAELVELEQHYIVFFPKRLARLRPLERRLSWLPAGAQTCTWAKRA